MAVQRTFSIIKPDAVAKNVVGEIVTRFEKAGLRVVASKMVQLSEREAGGFYAEHSERGFFKDLVAFMVSGPVIVQVLEGEDAIAKNRELMALPTLKKLLPAPSAPISPFPSTKTPYTVRIPRLLLLVKSRTSSPPPRCALAFAKANYARVKP